MTRFQCPLSCLGKQSVFTAVDARSCRENKSVFVRRVFGGTSPGELTVANRSGVACNRLRGTIRGCEGALCTVNVHHNSAMNLCATGHTRFICMCVTIIDLNTVVIPMGGSLINHRISFVLHSTRSGLLVSSVPLAISVPFVSVRSLSCHTSARGTPGTPTFPTSLARSSMYTLVCASNAAKDPGNTVVARGGRIHGIRRCATMIHFGPRSGILYILPVFRYCNLAAIILKDLCRRSAVIVLHSGDPARVVGAVVGCSIAVTVVIPPLCGLLTHHNRPDDVGAIRAFISNNTSLPRPITRSFCRQFNRPIRRNCNLARTSPIISVLPATGPGCLASNPTLPNMRMGIVASGRNPCIPNAINRLIIHKSGIVGNC